MSSPQRRLTSDLWRHAICAVGMLAVAFLILLLVPGAGRQDRIVRHSAATLFALAAYGPLYALLTHVAFRGLGGDELRRAVVSAAAPSQARRWLLAGPRSWAVTISVMALVAVFVLAVFARSAHVALTLGGIACALGTWVLLCGIFAMEYARAWAGDGGLQFPDDDDARRGFGDFWYVAIQASTTFATSDVAVVDRRTRQTVSVHAVTAWLFTTVIIALIVSLALPA